MRYDPSKSGMAGFFGSLEGEVMEILWREGALSGKDVQFYLRIKRKLSLTTVLTALARLEKKGLLTSSRPRRSKLYRPAVTRRAFLIEQISDLTGKLKQEFPEEYRAVTTGKTKSRSGARGSGDKPSHKSSGQKKPKQRGEKSVPPGEK